MPSEVIPCPACGHSVRVPESLFGQPVRCPACKAYFTAPLRDSSGMLGTAELLSEPPAAPVRSAPAKVIDDRSPVRLPAILLLLVGILGTCVNGVQAVRALTDPAGTRQNMIDLQRTLAQAMKQNFDEAQAKQAAEQQAEWIPILVSAALVVSLFPLLGALAMLRGGPYWLAVTGSSFALINLANCCCLIGFPVGVYCLVKLLDPDTRAWFKREQ